MDDQLLAKYASQEELIQPTHIPELHLFLEIS
jgi:hypothetical protein